MTLRPVGVEDDAFLRELYASTREDELALIPWREEQKRDFLDFQFRAQKAHYEEHHPHADHDAILCDGELAGRFYVERSASEINVVDLAILPGYRGRGIGSALLRGVIDEARDDGREVLFFVERSNRARNLYERLGFACTGDAGVYLEMRWRPSRVGGDDAAGLPHARAEGDASCRSVS